jgi:hypothetical protein
VETAARAGLVYEDKDVYAPTVVVSDRSASPLKHSRVRVAGWVVVWVVRWDAGGREDTLPCRPAVPLHHLCTTARASGFRKK